MPTTRERASDAFLYQPKKGQHAATGEISGRVDLMALKAMGTIFFTLFAASVYFTPFYFGGEDGGWTVLIDNLVNMPEFDVLNMLTLFQSIKLIFTLPSWDVTFVVPATITLGVLALQYSTEFVRWYFNRYLKNYKITAAHFRLPLMPVIAVFALGIYVQTGFLLVWDLLVGCLWGWTCQFPGMLCCALAGCLDDVNNRCFSCCRCLCGYGCTDDEFDVDENLNSVINGFAGSPITRLLDSKVGAQKPTEDLVRLWTDAADKKESQLY
jgi:hypothetical protein